jgi:protein-tyrosine phosphatase
MRILFVCMGNICRSPVVEAIARTRLARAGLDVIVDSAGTEGFHIGAAPDPRAIASARARGYDASAHRARQVVAADFDRFDSVLAMDRVNLAALHEYFPHAALNKAELFLRHAGLKSPDDVPDPYYGSLRDFERVIELAEAGVDGLIRRFRRPLVEKE